MSSHDLNDEERKAMELFGMTEDEFRAARETQRADEAAEGIAHGSKAERMLAAAAGMTLEQFRTASVDELVGGRLTLLHALENGTALPERFAHIGPFSAAYTAHLIEALRSDIGAISSTNA